jgi:PKD repeat protein
VRLTATGFIESDEWDFADGTTATMKNAKHSYTSTGEKTIHSA